MIEIADDNIDKKNLKIKLLVSLHITYIYVLYYITVKSKTLHWIKIIVFIIIGDVADGMYFIEEGTVVVKMDQDGDEIEISKLGKGQYFGELALVTHRPRAASVYADSDVKVACKFLIILTIFLL